MKEFSVDFVSPSGNDGMTAPTQKVEFQLDDGSVETMHAFRRPDGSFVLDNSPFHAYGISCGDTFSAVLSGEDRLKFVAVVERGGHSTYRVRLQAGAGHDVFHQQWGALDTLGCSYEGSGLGERRLYSIDVPSTTCVQAVYAVLEHGEATGVWQFEEAHYGHLQK